jgi:hypothetical protein
MNYRIFSSVHVVHTDRYGEEWVGERALPVFELNGDILGIVSVDHAERIAESMFKSIHHDGSYRIAVSNARKANNAIPDKYHDDGRDFP